jgi:hypothetical protein
VSQRRLRQPDMTKQAKFLQGLDATLIQNAAAALSIVRRRPSAFYSSRVRKSPSTSGILHPRCSQLAIIRPPSTGISAFAHERPNCARLETVPAMANARNLILPSS